MIDYLYQGQVDVFIMLAFAIIFSLTLHEFGHAISAKWFGDDTAERLGRVTLNPLPHIDPMGLLMIFTVGFGWAKPVPTNPTRFTKYWASPVIAFAGPFMNFLIAFVTINVYVLCVKNGLSSSAAAWDFVTILVRINLLLMVFNLIPLGPLDGHYILSYFLPYNKRSQYLEMNDRYGSYVLLGLVALSFAGVPIFSSLMSIIRPLQSLITIF